MYEQIILPSEFSVVPKIKPNASQFPYNVQLFPNSLLQTSDRSSKKTEKRFPMAASHEVPSLDKRFLRIPELEYPAAISFSMTNYQKRLQIDRPILQYSRRTFDLLAAIAYCCPLLRAGPLQVMQITSD